MNRIKSPFNFVPVSDKVYFPEWSNQVSHDIPFSDGESGYIEVELAAETPIYIRNWHSKEEEDSKQDNYKSFCKDPQGRFFIPASSFKGEIRAIMEILSFGKMHIDTSMAFAQRDWDNKALYPLKDVKVQQTIRCGYLKYIKGNYSIIDHGTPKRINHKEIDAYINLVKPMAGNIMAKHFSNNSGFKLDKPVDSIDPKTAEFKYELLKGINLKDLSFSYVDDRKAAVRYDPAGNIQGNIVMTGSSNQWKERGKNNGKFYEFVFPAEEGEKYPLKEELINEYRFIYSDNNLFKELTTNKIQQIPVFFRVEGNSIKDFGLAFMYKLPYRHTPDSLLGKDHHNSDYDLAETIFGRADKDRNSSLKGRVQFSHLFATEYKEGNDVRLTLAGPKASYYPMYLKQTGGNYKTYNDDDAILAGRKRYVVRNGIWSRTSTDNVDTVFRPLEAGSKFKGKIFFHNLRPVELGALLSALTFHNTKDCRHQIGLAKPYGYGRVKVCVSNGTLVNDQVWYMSEFEREMSKFKSDWCNCEQIEELIALAMPVTVDDDRFDYMQLDMAGQNEFVNAKKEKEYLHLHTIVIGHKYQLASISKKTDDENYLKLVALAREYFENGEYEKAYDLYIELQKWGRDSFKTELEAAKEAAVKKLKEDAYALEKEGKYDEVIEIGKKLIEKWGEPFDINRIEALKAAKNKSDITEGFKLNSIGACATVLSKWIKTHGSISNEDLNSLASSIKAQLPAAKKDLVKKWEKEKEWGPIEKILGKELSHSLYLKIFGF